MTIYEILKEALLARKPVAIIREGTERHVCPHVIGTKHSKEGTSYANVLLYQFDGYSEKGLGPDGSDKNWRCVAVDGIEKAWVIDGQWHTVTNLPTKKSYCVDDIDVQVWL